MTKKIICGEIREDFMDTPINIFKKAVELSKIDSFTVKTNNPQLVEALEVLCGEKNIVFIIRSGGENYQQDTAMAMYEYLGDVYDIVNSLRFQQELDMQSLINVLKMKSTSMVLNINLPVKS